MYTMLSQMQTDLRLRCKGECQNTTEHAGMDVIVQPGSSSDGRTTLVRVLYCVECGQVVTKKETLDKR